MGTGKGKNKRVKTKITTDNSYKKVRSIFNENDVQFLGYRFPIKLINDTGNKNIRLGEYYLNKNSGNYDLDDFNYAVNEIYQDLLNEELIVWKDKVTNNNQEEIREMLKILSEEFSVKIEVLNGGLFIMLKNKDNEIIESEVKYQKRITNQNDFLNSDFSNVNVIHDHPVYITIGLITRVINTAFNNKN